MAHTSFVLAATAVPLAGALAQRIRERRLKHPVYERLLAKLIGQGDLERARKVTSAWPHAPLALGVRAALKRATELLDAPPAGSPAKSYRDAPSGIGRARVAAELRLAFLRAYRPAAREMVAVGSVALATAFLGAAAVVHGLATRDELYVLGIALGGVAALLGAWTGWTALRVPGQARAATDLVLEPLCEHVLAGKKPPPLPIHVDIYRDRELLRSEVATGDLVSIGARRQAHVRLEGEGVSRVHCMLENGAPEAATLVDLGSKAGTQVAGQPVKKVRLAHGDAFEVGPFRLVVGLGKPPPRAGEPSS